MNVIEPWAHEQGFCPDIVICADDVQRGRPVPWMLYRAAEKMNAFPPDTLIAVDDTTVGIQAVLNAGVWTVAVVKT